MGGGHYRAADWEQLKKSRKLSSDNNVNQTFTRTGIKDSLNSRFISCRESIDSEDSPESTPIIIGFDVTGSMGYLANSIATKSLNDTILKILSTKCVTNPHIMCAAFTKPGEPIQATQFEADIRVVEQLLDFKISGSNPNAADNLLWYFAAKHTRIDSYNKRGKKGILIGIGDERCNSLVNNLTASEIKSSFDDDVMKECRFMSTMMMASEKYELFHIVIGYDIRFDLGSTRESYKNWCNAMPGRVARIKALDVGYLDWLIVSIIRISQGENKREVIDEIPEDRIRKIVEWGIKDLDFGQINFQDAEAYDPKLDAIQVEKVKSNQKPEQKLDKEPKKVTLKDKIAGLFKR